jgi:CheY-like chemotaxis protein
VSLKIMVVDDEPLNMKLIRPLAAPLGHTVLTFDDSQDVGERAEKQRFDVVFLGMSRPDGLELVRRIRNSQPNREATIVMLSGIDDAESVRKALGEGADFVFTKPVTAASLRSMLAAMDSAGWKGKRHTIRLPLFTDVVCIWDDRKFPFRSMNISESGMLMQTSADIDIDVGKEVFLEFKISEVHASLNVRARIVRKEGTERIGMAFIDLAPEDKNAIQLYVMVRLKNPKPPRDLSRIGMNRLLVPNE